MDEQLVEKGGEQVPMRQDPDRARWPETGIFVRAMVRERWRSVDIARLDRASLLRWLRSDEGLAERTLLMLLGHPAE